MIQEQKQDTLADMITLMAIELVELLNSLGNKPSDNRRCGVKEIKMSKITIDSERLKELEETEYKMRCLEGAGVDNWEGYDIALDAFRKKKEEEEKLVEMFNDILEILCEGIEEPAGSGCGFGFKDKTQDDAQNRFNSLVREYCKTYSGNK